MPRDIGTGLYHYPDGTPGNSGQTVFSARYNAFINDLSNTLNQAQPINMGGTGGSNAVEARDNLEAEVATSRVVDYNTHFFEAGSFYSDDSAVGSPIDGRYFVGTARLLGSSPTQHITLEVTTSDGTPGRSTYTRQKVAGAWGPWTSGGVTTQGGITGIGDDAADMFFGLKGDAPGSRFVINTESNGSGVDLFVVQKNGDLIMNNNPASDVRLALNAAAGKMNDVIFSNAGSARFVLRNDGNNLYIFTFDDLGAISGTAFTLNRTTQHITVQEPTAAGEVATKNYVDTTTVATKNYVDTTTVASAGDVMTGALTTAGSTGVMATVTPGQQLTITSAGGAGDGAFMAFVRPGVFAGVLGLDTDNALKYGGWANGAVAWRVVHEGLTDVTFTSNVYLNGGLLRVRSPAAGLARILLDDELGSYQGELVWDRSNVKVVHGASGQAMILDPGGKVYLGAALMSRQGYSGSYGANGLNFHWTTTNLQAWVDSTNVGNITITSDYRTKRDVKDLTGMWDTVKALRPISYTHADWMPAWELEARTKEATEKGVAVTPFVAGDNLERWGFIAHELQDALLPTAATGHKDVEGTLQSPNLMPIIATLTKALQEAQIRIETLEAKIQALEAAR